MNKIIITYGLPGSGKTTWVKQYLKNIEVENKSISRRGRKRVKHLSLDDFFINTSSSPLQDKSALEVNLGFLGIADSNKVEFDEFIVDGLFFLNKHLVTFLNTINLTNVLVEIRCWKPDRERCLKNDADRLFNKERNKDSSITIKNAPFEYPDLNHLSKLFPTLRFSCILQEVYVVPDYLKFASEYNIFLTKDKYLYSDSWSLGGTYGNYASDELTPIAPGKPLTSFVEFDELIEKVAPNISMMQYKDLYNKTVIIKRDCETDYYGGEEYTARYSCNVEKLYELLNEKGLIKK